MLTQKSKFERLKEHKTELMIAGTSILAIALGSTYLLSQVNTAKIKISKFPTNSLDTIPSSHRDDNINKDVIKKMCTVKEHIRNLPAGHHPAPEKIASAAEKGIYITNHQTYVASYERQYAA